MFDQVIVNKQIKLWSVFVHVNKCQCYECIAVRFVEKRNLDPATRCCEVVLKL